MAIATTGHQVEVGKAEVEETMSGTGLPRLLVKPTEILLALARQDEDWA